MAGLKQVAIALDQLLNAILGGWADETLSSRAYRTNPKAASFIDAVFFWDPEHCKNSFRSERLRLQLPPELRD